MSIPEIIKRRKLYWVKWYRKPIMKCNLYNDLEREIGPYSGIILKAE